MKDTKKIIDNVQKLSKHILDKLNEDIKELERLAKKNREDINNIGRRTKEA